MSDTLDEKLKAIVKDAFAFQGSGNVLSELDKIDIENEAVEVVSEIMQAIADAGYKCYPEISKQQLADGGYMTGQEWYSRFNNELKRQGSGTLEPRMLYREEIEANVLEAAKRATGIS